MTRRVLLSGLAASCVLLACTPQGGTPGAAPTPIPVPSAADTCGPTAAPGAPVGCAIVQPSGSPSATPSRAASASPAPQASGVTPMPGPSGLAAAPLVGEPAPDLEYFDPANVKHKLSEHRGKPVLVTLFAHWCGHCQREVPVVAAWAKQQEAKGLVWLPIEGSKATPDDVAKFATTYKVDAPLYRDPSGAVIGQIKAAAYPTHMFVDATGTVRGGETGTFDQAGFAALLEAATAAK